MRTSGAHISQSRRCAGANDVRQAGFTAAAHEGRWEPTFSDFLPIGDKSPREHLEDVLKKFEVFKEEHGAEYDDV